MRLGLSIAIVLVIVFGVSARTQNTFGALPLTVISPADNPSTPEKVALGRFLFWDPVLSGGKDVACATCHHPNTGYSDNRGLSIGVHTAKRNSPTVLNTAFTGITSAGHYDPAAAPMFWDMRARGLEAQALEPIKSPEEMRGDNVLPGGPVAGVVARLAAITEYRQQFTRAFGGADAVTAANLGKAIAAYERSLTAVQSPFDRYTRGERDAMTPAQIQGLARFESAGCGNCHNGPMFSDYQLHVLGVPDHREASSPDAGANGAHAFRTPTLRNLAYTAPYMHSGVQSTLDGVLNFYNTVNRGRGGRGGRGGPGGGGRGGRGGGQINPNVPRDQLDPLLRQVNVRNGRFEILEFLKALNDDSFDRSVPERVPSGLTPGGRAR